MHLLLISPSDLLINVMLNAIHFSFNTFFFTRILDSSVCSMICLCLLTSEYFVMFSAYVFITNMVAEIFCPDRRIEQFPLQFPNSFYACLFCGRFHGGFSCLSKVDKCPLCRKKFSCLKCTGVLPREPLFIPDIEKFFDIPPTRSNALKPPSEYEDSDQVQTIKCKHLSVIAKNYPKKK